MDLEHPKSALLLDPINNPINYLSSDRKCADFLELILEEQRRFQMVQFCDWNPRLFLRRLIINQLPAPSYHQPHIPALGDLYPAQHSEIMLANYSDLDY